MNEVEVKAKVSDFTEIQPRLIGLGCSFSEPLFQKDRIYLPSGIELPDKTIGTPFLRIRNLNGKHILTLKKQLDTEFENIEHELVIDDPNEADAMAQALGFHTVMYVSKTRITCTYKDLTICLDDVEKLGYFVEVEKMTHDTDHAKIKQDMFEFLRSVGIREEAQVFKGYATLLYELENSFRYP